MPVLDAVIVGRIHLPEIGGGPIVPAPQPPLGIWGPTDPRPTPPIYIPVPPPSGGGEPGVPAHPIYIPVFPAHPIVIPVPPEGGEPKPPVVWPPLPGGVPPVGGYPGYPEPPLGIWGGGNVPMPNPPIYIPITPPPIEGQPPGVPSHPIYLPVYPTHPIVLPPDGGKPQPPPAMVNPPSSQPGFWGYSMYYDSMVFVPYEGAGP